MLDICTALQLEMRTSGKFQRGSRTDSGQGHGLTPETHARLGSSEGGDTFINKDTIPLHALKNSKVKTKMTVAALPAIPEARMGTTIRQ
jgi:hypothetical protein